jgi:hypothetical protein
MNPVPDISFLNQMEQLQQQYYSVNGKNTFFKMDQKMDCASAISSQLDISELLNKTVYIIPNTNRVFFDYTIFKLYANPANYSDIMNHVLNLFYTCIQQTGSYEAHLNMKTFSVSAATRYKDLIRNFCNECFRLNLKFSTKLTNMYIYHTPSMVDHISAMLIPFLDKEVQAKLIMLSKTESDARMAELFSNSLYTRA